MRKYEYKQVYDQFNKLGYELISSEYINCKEKLEYICNKHKEKGSQYITFDSIKSGCGCNYCGIEKANSIPKNRKNIIEVIKYINGIENITYYGYNYNKNRLCIEYLCNIHPEIGIQKMDYNNILRSNFLCKSCRKEHIRKQNFEEELYDLNPDIEILSDYVGDRLKVNVRCLKDGYTWDVTASSLLDHPTCPKCRCTTSLSEKIIINLLDSYNVKHEFQKRLKGCKDKRILPFDFYLNDYNVLIEYDGEHHYKKIPRGNSTVEEQELILLDVKNKDRIKTEYCINNNIPLIRIPYWERNNMECFLLNELKKINIKIA